MSYSKELQIGKAAEHLVVADLLLQGYPAFLADAGAPFDIVLQVDGKLITVQVKATLTDPILRRRARTETYRFGLRHGKGQRKVGPRADVYAFVVLKTKEIAYLTPLDFKSTLPQLVEFRTREAAARSIRVYTHKVRNYEPRIISDYPFSAVLTKLCTT